MGDGEGDAQKKATLDTLSHGITNAFQCHCLCHCIFVRQVLDMARYMDILHVLNYWILGIFDFFVILPLELVNIFGFLNF